MAKRFGRNQRRRMREELAAKAVEIEGLGQTVDLEKRKFAALWEMNEKQDRVIRRTARLLGENFIGLAPKERLSLQLITGEVIRIPVPADVPSYLTPFDAIDAMSMVLDRVEIGASNGSVSLDYLRQHVDVIYRTPAGDVGYGFGRNTFHGVPVRYAAERIANAMAEHLVNSEQFIKWSGVKPEVPAERK